ncbi:MAG TPA: hypothetical protein PKC58_17550 [Ignavibacteria bacterium]|nr:hypothetical protein [Ignavibacteria bacterium]
MIKNFEKYRSQKIIVSTGTILLVLSLLYNILFLLTNKKVMIAYLWSDLLYDFAEFFFDLTSSIIVQFLVLLIWIFIIYKIYKSRENKYQKIVVLISIFVSFALTYQKGKDIVDLKTIGYDIVNKIEEYYLKNNSLPGALSDLYPINYSRDSLAYIIKNFTYQPYQSLKIRDYRFFIDSTIILPTMFVYNERKKIFVNFD